MTELYKLAFDCATEFLQQANDLPIQVNDQARANLKNLDFPLQVNGVD